MGSAWNAYHASESIIDTPLECNKVPSQSSEFVTELNKLGKEGALQLPINVVNVDFLLRVDDYLRQLQNRKPESEEWNWKACQRSDSIDSNTAVQV